MRKRTNKKSAYLKGSLTSSRYGLWRTKFSDFFDSERFFLTKKRIPAGTTILDIGGAAGGLGNALRESIQSRIDYTVLDPSMPYLTLGRKRFPWFRFMHGYFPKDAPERQYDFVTMLALFPQIPDWKRALLQMAKHSRRFVLFSAVVKLNGPTTVDKDTSYCYYFDSGERVHQVVHNLYELVNFCSIHEMQAKSVSFYGYHVKEQSTSNRSVPNKEQIRGCFLLERFPDKKSYPGRVAGVSKEFFKKQGIDAWRPEVRIIIDKKPFKL